MARLREPTRPMDEVLDALHCEEGSAVLVVQSGIGSRKFLDGRVASGHRRLLGDLGTSEREELPGIELNLIPRGIPEHHVETTVLHHFGKR